MGSDTTKVKSGLELVPLPRRIAIRACIDQSSRHTTACSPIGLWV
jgi:hypothetical protein